MKRSMGSGVLVETVLVKFPTELYTTMHDYVGYYQS